MAKNTGTLITAAIRPNDSEDRIASALSNEIQGGLHSYETLLEVYSIITERRQWGMKATVYNDTINNGTWTLQYGKSDTVITNNLNWVKDTVGSGSSGSGEWVDSVITVSDEIIAPVTDGNRYLVGTSPTGDFSGNENKIAIYLTSLNGGSGGWQFLTPTEGQSLRVDDVINVVFKYQDSVWVKEYLNQVRYITPTTNDGLTYSFTTLEQNKIDVYSYSRYEAIFGTTNSGTVSLSIDGLPFIEIKKNSNGLLVDLANGDIVPNISYDLVYNNGVLQANIPTTTGVIGPAEDGDYTDGLYPDFTSSTPIGTAVDRFNEVLKALVPPQAPSLNSWSSIRTGSSLKLSFNSDTSSPFSFSSATQSPYGSVNINGVYSSSGFRLGVFTASGILSGVINSAVVVHPSTPFPAYNATSFGQATSGTMSLLLNGITISSTNLATSSAINTVGATGGLILSAPTSSRFPSGLPFDSFQNRTGSWQISLTNSSILNGYNWVDLRHDISPQSFTVSRYEFILDRGNTFSVTAQDTINNPITWASPTTKFLSGVQYYSNTNSELRYQTTLNNVYSFTFRTDNSAIRYVDSAGLFGVFATAIPNIGVAGNANPQLLVDERFRLLANRRAHNSGTIIYTEVNKPFNSTFINLGQSIYQNLFIDTFPESSTDSVEEFDDERYRRINGSTPYQVGVLDTVSQAITGTWSSTQSLVDNNGLQVVGGGLRYPFNLNYGLTGSTVVNPNFGSSNLNYSSLPVTGWTSSGSGNTHRVYTRLFRLNPLINYTQISLNIQSSTNLTFISIGAAMSGNNVGYLECKLPLNTTISPTQTGNQTPASPLIDTSTQATGWMDCTQGYSGVNGWGNGRGCVNGSITGTVTNSTRIITFGGSGGTIKSNGYILIRITLPSGYTGDITRMSISPA